MYFKELNKQKNRLKETYHSLMCSRTMLIDDLDIEYQRHVKLTKNKENKREELRRSLNKSRNLKKLRSDMITIKTNIKSIQNELKNIKKCYKELQINRSKNLKH
jgi:predicted  nucleic acid-binding Zn-ribbon protein